MALRFISRHVEGLQQQFDRTEAAIRSYLKLLQGKEVMGGSLEEKVMDLLSPFAIDNVYGYEMAAVELLQLFSKPDVVDALKRHASKEQRIYYANFFLSLYEFFRSLKTEVHLTQIDLHDVEISAEGLTLERLRDLEAIYKAKLSYLEQVRKIESASPKDITIIKD